MGSLISQSSQSAKSGVQSPLNETNGMAIQTAKKQIISQMESKAMFLPKSEEMLFNQIMHLMRHGPLSESQECFKIYVNEVLNKNNIIERIYNDFTGEIEKEFISETEESSEEKEVKDPEASCSVIFEDEIRDRFVCSKVYLLIQLFFYAYLEIVVNSKALAVFKKEVHPLIIRVNEIKMMSKTELATVLEQQTTQFSAAKEVTKNSMFCRVFRTSIEKLSYNDTIIQQKFDDLMEKLTEGGIDNILCSLMELNRNFISNKDDREALLNLVGFLKGSEEDADEFLAEIGGLREFFTVQLEYFFKQIHEKRKQMEALVKYIHEYVDEEATIEDYSQYPPTEEEKSDLVRMGILTEEQAEMMNPEDSISCLGYLSPEFGLLEEECVTEEIQELYNILIEFQGLAKERPKDEVKITVESDENDLKETNLLHFRGSAKDNESESKVVQLIRIFAEAVSTREIKTFDAVHSLNKFVNGHEAKESELIDFNGERQSPLIARKLTINPEDSEANMKAPIAISEFEGDIIPTIDGFNLSFMMKQLASSSRETTESFEVQRLYQEQIQRFFQNWEKASFPVRVIAMQDLVSALAASCHEDGSSDDKSMIHRTFEDVELSNRLILINLVLQTAHDVDSMRSTRKAASRAQEILLTPELMTENESAMTRFFLSNPENIQATLEEKRGQSFSIRYMPNVRKFESVEQRMGVFLMIPKLSHVQSRVRYKYRFFIEERKEGGQWVPHYISRLYISAKSKLVKMYRDTTSLLNLQTIIPRYTTTNLLLNNYVAKPCDSMESWFGCSHFVRSNPDQESKDESLADFMKANKVSVFTTWQMEQHLLAFETAYEDLPLYNFIQTLLVPVERNDKEEFVATSMETYLTKFSGEDTFDKEILQDFFSKLKDKEWLGKRINLGEVRDQLQKLTEIPLDSILGSTSSNSISVQWSKEYDSFFCMLATPKSKKNIDAVLMSTKLQVEYLDFDHMCNHLLYIPLIRMFVKNQLAAAREISINTPEAKVVCACSEAISQIISSNTIGDLIMKEKEKASMNRKLFIQFGLDSDNHPLILELDGKKWNNCMDMGMFRAVSSCIFEAVFGYETKVQYFMDMVFGFYSHKALEIPLAKFPNDSITLMKEVFSLEELKSYFDFPASLVPSLRDSNKKRVRLPEIVSSSIHEYLVKLKDNIESLTAQKKLDFNSLVVAVKAPTGMGQGIFSSFSSLFGSLVLSYIEEKLYEQTGVRFGHSQTSDDMLIIGKQPQNMSADEVLALVCHLSKAFNIRMSVQKCTASNEPECMFNSCKYDFRECYWVEACKRLGIRDPHLQKKSLFNQLKQSGKKFGIVEEQHIEDYFNTRESRICRLVDCKLPTFSRLLKGSFGMNFDNPISQRLSYISSFTDFLSYFPYKGEHVETIIEGNRTVLNIAMANWFIYGDQIEGDSLEIRASKALSDPVPFVQYTTKEGYRRTYLTASTEVQLLLSSNKLCTSKYGEIPIEMMGNLLEYDNTPLGFRMKMSKGHTFEKQSRQQSVLGSLTTTGSIGMASKYIKSLGDSEESIADVVSLIKRFRGSFVPTKEGRREQPKFILTDLELNSFCKEIQEFDFTANGVEPYAYLAFTPGEKQDNQVNFSDLMNCGLMTEKINQRPDSLLDLVLAVSSQSVFDDTRDLDMIVQIVPPISCAFKGVRARPKPLETVTDYLVRISGSSPHDVYVVAQQRAGVAAWKGRGVLANFENGIWNYFIVDDDAILLVYQNKGKLWRRITSTKQIEQMRFGPIKQYVPRVSVTAAEDFMNNCTYDGTGWQYFRARRRYVPVTRRKDLNTLLQNDINSAFDLPALEEIVSEHINRMSFLHYQSFSMNSVFNFVQDF